MRTGTFSIVWCSRPMSNTLGPKRMISILGPSIGRHSRAFRTASRTSSSDAGAKPNAVSLGYAQSPSKNFLSVQLSTNSLKVPVDRSRPAGQIRPSIGVPRLQMPFKFLAWRAARFSKTFGPGRSSPAPWTRVRSSERLPRGFQCKPYSR